MTTHALHFCYSVIAGSTYGYVIGRMHERGHIHWKNVVVAVAAGILWPVTILYGAYLVHTNKAPLTDHTEQPTL